MRSKFHVTNMTDKTAQRRIDSFMNHLSYLGISKEFFHEASPSSPKSAVTLSNVSSIDCTNIHVSQPFTPGVWDYGRYFIYGILLCTGFYRRIQVSILKLKNTGECTETKEYR